MLLKSTSWFLHSSASVRPCIFDTPSELLCFEVKLFLEPYVIACILIIDCELDLYFNKYSYFETTLLVALHLGSVFLLTVTICPDSET